MYKAMLLQELFCSEGSDPMWYAGVDWADTHHVVVVVDETGKPVATRQVEHTVEGLAQLTSFLLDIVGTPERREELACIIETTHGLLITALLEAGFPVYPVNPKTVDRHRKPAGAKTDAIDAYLLARTGRSDFADLRRLKPDSALIQELKTLTRDQESLIASQTRLVNQLTACLKTYYPVALTLFEPTPSALYPGFPPSLPDSPGGPTGFPRRHSPASQAGKAPALGSRRSADLGAAATAFLASGCHHHTGQVTLDARAGPAPPSAGGPTGRLRQGDCSPVSTAYGSAHLRRTTRGGKAACAPSPGRVGR